MLKIRHLRWRQWRITRDNRLAVNQSGGVRQYDQSAIRCSCECVDRALDLRSFTMGVSIGSTANEGAAAAIERSSDPA
jgi:hypothetical protein